MFKLTQEFIKCQSLGNDFVLFDWLDIDAEIIAEVLRNTNWPTFVIKACDRQHGIGADGVLVIRQNSSKQLETLVFNADGSNGFKCFNGLRCVARYLVTKKNYSKKLSIFMGDNLMDCQVNNSGQQIVIKVGRAIYLGEHTITVLDKTFHGHKIDIGNPHFVIFQPITLSWLTEYGKLIAQHLSFPECTNVEFVAHGESYELTIYERGCGITMACGTGAAAVMQVLYQLQQIKLNEKVLLKMPGGMLISYLDYQQNIVQCEG